jgi:hypothetical protein
MVTVPFKRSDTYLSKLSPEFAYVTAGICREVEMLSEGGGLV